LWLRLRARSRSQRGLLGTICAERWTVSRSANSADAQPIRDSGQNTTTHPLPSLQPGFASIDACWQHELQSTALTVHWCVPSCKIAEQGSCSCPRDPLLPQSSDGRSGRPRFSSLSCEKMTFRRTIGTTISEAISSVRRGLFKLHPLARQPHD
jgi:hypothetical protein